MQHLSKLKIPIRSVSPKERYEKMDLESLDRLLISTRQKRKARTHQWKKGEGWFLLYWLFLCGVKGYTGGMGQDMKITPWYLEEPNHSIIFLLVTLISYSIVSKLYWRDKANC